MKHRPSNSRQLFFVHVEKTAGSSLIDSLVKSNEPEHRRIGGLRSYLQHRTAPCVSGHVPYGLHVFSTKPVDYITMLRDPIDRAVSWYYFIKDLVRTDLWIPHPLREYAESVTIFQFYQNPKYSNMQTRFLAGWHYHKAYPLFHHSDAYQQIILSKAKSHLTEFVAFGLQDRYDESVSVFQNTLGWQRYTPIAPQAKTKQRPSLAEVDELNPSVLPKLRASHELDLSLYAYAQSLFEEQLR